jgi:hypothetical protein
LHWAIHGHTAAELIDSLEKAIFSLENMPQRGALRKTGAYANRGYRQLGKIVFFLFL